MSLNIKDKKLKLIQIKYKGKEYAIDKNGDIIKDIYKYNLNDKFNMLNGKQKVFVKNNYDVSIFNLAKSKVKSNLDSINKKKYLEWAESEFALGGPRFLRLVKKYNKSIKRLKTNSFKRRSNYKRDTR